MFSNDYFGSSFTTEFQLNLPFSDWISGDKMEYVLYLTNDCNLNCIYCYEGKKRNQIMDFNIIQKLMEDESKKKEISRISFFGGEPLLQKQLIYDTVNLGNQLSLKTRHRFVYSLSTNGTLIDDDFIRFCKKNKVAVGISIDGGEFVHNLNRKTFQSTGSFEKVLENAQKCLKANLKVMALPVICMNNVIHLSDSVNFLIQLGFQNITLNLNYAEKWTEESIEILKKQCSKVVDLYYHEYEKKKNIKIYPLDTKIYYGIHQNQKCTGGCNGNRIAVDTDGSYYPCLQFIGNSKYIIGNYQEGIDDKKKKDLIVKRISSQTICKDCAYQRRCLHDCGCARMMTSGDILEVTPLICETERMFIEEADKLGNRLYQDFPKQFMMQHYF